MDFTFNDICFLWCLLLVHVNNNNEKKAHVRKKYLNKNDNLPFKRNMRQPN